MKNEMIFFWANHLPKARLRAPLSPYNSLDKIMRVNLLSELLGGELVKNCFIWPIAPHTGTHLLQLLYESASGIEGLEHRVPCLNNQIRVTAVGLGHFKCR